MIIRPAEDRDNGQLLAIERQAPQGDAIRLLSERTDYFVRAKKFPRSILLVAEDEVTLEILGVMGVGFVDVHLQGKIYRGGLIFDWRSNPNFQKGLPRHMFRLWQAVQKEVAKENLEFLFGYVKEDNTRSLGISQRSGATITEERVFLTIPVHKQFGAKRRLSEGVLQTAVTDEGDYPELERVYGGYDLFPSCPLKPSDAFGSKYHFGTVTHQDSFLKIWDSTNDYTQRVLNMPWYFHLARPIFRFGSHIIPLPRIPKIGDQVRYWYLYDVVVTDQEKANALLEKARRLAIENHIDYLVICLNAKEKHYSWFSRYAWVKLKYYLLFQPIGDVPIPKEPTYFDIAYI